MLQPGVYPAAVTPFDEKGRPDLPSVARMLAWFEHCGCTGAVIAGTNGEGPSLSAAEKRDLIAAAVPLQGKLDLILGIATPSLDEATWLTRRAADAGAKGVLVMPPFYFRDAPEEGVRRWFEAVLEGSPLPVIVYNFPQKTGVTLGADLLGSLSRHPYMAGAKDSSGSPENLPAFRAALGPEKLLFVGDETLLLDALGSGWSGTISGASNVLARWISRIVVEWRGDDRESAVAKFELLEPLIGAIRRSPQPASHKALLHRWGILERPDVRLPLLSAPSEVVEDLDRAIRERIGVQAP